MLKSVTCSCQRSPWYQLGGQEDKMPVPRLPDYARKTANLPWIIAITQNYCNNLLTGTCVWSTDISAPDSRKTDKRWEQNDYPYEMWLSYLLLLSSHFQRKQWWKIEITDFSRPRHRVEAKTFKPNISTLNNLRHFSVNKYLNWAGHSQ